MEEKEMSYFESTMRKGFHMTFENGLTISVQWGAGNYCDNYFPKDRDFTCSKDASSRTAEVAVFDSSDEFIDPQKFMEESIIKGDEQVVGYLTADQVAQIIYNVSKYPN